MDVAELKHSIKNNTFDNFLIFSGEEYMVQRIYIQQIAKARSLKIQYIDSVNEIYNRLGSISLFNEHYLYIVVDDKEFMQSERMIEDVQSRLKTDMLILRCISLDKRLKFYKTHKDAIIEFETLKSEILKRYIQKEINLSDRSCEILMEICGNNYGQCLLEIYKIQRYVDGSKNLTITETIYDTVFRQLVMDGTIHTPPRDAIFDFVKAVLQNKPKLAYELLEDCKEIGEAPLVMLSVLYQNSRNVLQVQTCTNSNIEKSTGLSVWQVKHAKECVNKLSTEDLIYLIKLIQNTEVRIKQGEIEAEIAVEYVLARLY